MAKMFYTAAEAAQKLGKTEDDLKGLVRQGKLREFRDAGTINYKVDDVDGIAGESGEGAGSVASASASGEIVLEPVEDSGIDLSSSGSDVLSLDEADVEDTAAGTRGSTTAAKQAKEGSSAVPSVGVNVFDDDELDEQVDPLAQTAVSDVAGLGIEAAGSGSGIMELSREGDDTSFGRELLDEIYTGEEEGAVEMGEATRAGLEEAAPEKAEAAEGEEEEAVLEAPVEESAPVRQRAVVTQVVEYAPDALSTSLTALLVVAVAVMWFAGLAAAALVRGITPSLIRWVYADLAIFAGGAVVVGAIAAGVSYILAKRSR